MSLFTLDEIFEVTGARSRAGGMSRRAIRRLTTDSRDVRAGDLFVALRGERFDGHEFVASAVERGAVGAIVESSFEWPASVERRLTLSGGRTDIPYLLHVADPLLAYQQLASYHRSRFDIPVVAVTGSNGKTTTKEMVACVLSEQWNVLKTEGNLNNRIGVPQTLLRLTARHQAAVIEMGVDHKGQTSRLAEIVRPTIGLITNIGPDHLEFFGSLEASAQAKGELLDWLKPDDAVVLNADDAFFEYLASRARCRVLSFGDSQKAQVRAVDHRSDGTGVSFQLMLPDRARYTTVRLGAFGTHNVSNALAAAAVGAICNISGVKIARGLSRFRPAAMRSQIEMLNGIRIINDCYNANPASMKAAISLLQDLGSGGRTIAVLGDMLELGPESAALHREVGSHVAARQVTVLIACGPAGGELAEGARLSGMADDHIHRVSDADDAARLLASMVRPGDVVLVKASRGMKMERIVEALRPEASQPQAGSGLRRAGMKTRKQ